MSFLVLFTYFFLPGSKCLFLFVWSVFLVVCLLHISGSFDVSLFLVFAFGRIRSRFGSSVSFLVVYCLLLVLY